MEWVIWTIWILFCTFLLSRSLHVISHWKRGPRKLTEKQQALNDAVLRKRSEGDKL